LINAFLIPLLIPPANHIGDFPPPRGGPVCHSPSGPIAVLSDGDMRTREVQAFRQSHNLSFVPVAGHFEAAAQGRQNFPLEAALVG